MDLLIAAVSGFAFKTVAFVFLIGLLVIIHEWGHYIMAKRAGVPVEEFSIGFGPLLTKMFQRDETTFNLRALPLGGYVRTVGMEPGDDDPRGYNSQPVWTRVKIISAGAIINLIFGLILMVVLGMTSGLPAEDRSAVGVGEILPGSAAQQAGLREGDRIVSIDGMTVTDPEMLTKEIRAHAGQMVKLTVQRTGATVPITAVPKAEKEDGQTVGRLGFAVTEDYVWERQGIGGSIVGGTVRSYKLAESILKGIATKATWTKRQLGGPIAIAKAAGGYAERGLKYYVLFMAMFSINLGVLNLLPIPVLDGGHLVLLAVEAVRGRRLSVKAIQAFQGVGFAILFMFFCFIMVSDVLRAMGKG